MTKRAKTRRRYGYLWCTEREIKALKTLFNDCGVKIKGGASGSQADFIRIATISLAKILRSNNIKIDFENDEEKIINFIVEKFIPPASFVSKYNSTYEKATKKHNN